MIGEPECVLKNTQCPGPALNLEKQIEEEQATYGDILRIHVQEV